jgi:hypothetical protein
MYRYLFDYHKIYLIRGEGVFDKEMPVVLESYYHSIRMIGKKIVVILK